MSDAKRGRPAMPDAEKRQQIGVRTSPALKADLERAAGENGRSVAQEAELRLVQSFEQDARAGDAETTRLLSMIANEIAAIQQTTGKRWHRDLTTWAAVSEALYRGAIVTMRPDNAADDETVTRAWDSYWGISQGKRHVVDELREAGLTVPDRTPRYGGVFEKALTSERRLVTKAIDTLTVDAAEKDRLRVLVKGLVLLDHEEEQALKRFKTAIEPYTQAETKGRQLYHEQASERTAKLAAIAGAIRDSEHGA